MGRPAGWMTELTGRSAMKSPGKPSHRREVERWFWREIAKGLSTEDAAAAVGVSSAAGVRWFRERGGMATLLRDPETCRYLCFAEREEIALLRAGPRPPSSPPTWFCASTCRHAWPATFAAPTGPPWRARRSRRGRVATSRAARTAGGRRRGAR